MGPRNGFLWVLRDSFRGFAQLTDIPKTGYATLFISHQKYSSIFTVHPAPEFSGRCTDIGVRGGSFVSRDNIIVDICDEEKQVAFETGSDGVLTGSM
jgi:hypothetical protein